MCNLCVINVWLWLTHKQIYGVIILLEIRCNIMMESNGRYHWSNTALTAKFFTVSATTAIPWLSLLLYPRKSTIILTILITLFFIYIEYVKKISTFDFFKLICLKITGRKKGTIDIVRKFL